MNMAAKTVIDGSVLEGGGQILRNTAALSCLLCKSVTITNIRAGRSKPGLRPQHLMGLELVRDISKGQLKGGHVESTEVTLSPQGQIRGGKYQADTKTAGSTSLLLQASLPCLLFADTPSELVLKGGTNADMAPPVDYFIEILKPMVEKFGVHFDCSIVKRGFFPKGGGVVSVKTQPIKSLSPIDMTDPGELVRITGLAYVAGVLPKKVAHNMADSARSMLTRQYRVPVEIEAVKDGEDRAFGNGCGMILVAETSTGCRLAGTALGKRGVPAEKVGEDAAEMLLGNLRHNVCCDEYLQDQLIILMALAEGRSRVLCGPISLHTQTAIYIAETLTKAKFEIKAQGKDVNLIECDGTGLVNQCL